ncbi:lipopolysaccharide kinase InaA family protein [Halanaerobacter jeridensis]|uniref:tRNA A-37 threonylcarbamoyl transferase component Bud32 n=1 Tax=Halanaerobacter jeridensis TaxID=706427 RepID=A0A939BPE5_9FIRM|nr:lipopolysaccharide kinase InaA family protein [Halanaerobacter jeridensis]MBM7556942.1 tRNA A-37 threonylcarbamoyl transferase component Bud32 [Halanaerobacter jeridensis]
MKKKDIDQEINYIKANQSEHSFFWLNDKYGVEKLKKIVENINSYLNTGTKIYNERNLLVHIESDIASSNSDLVIKKFKLNRKYDKLRFCFLDSKAVRSLRMALALQKIDIKTPEPVAVVEKRGKFNQIIYSYFITKYLDYDYNLLDIVRDEQHPMRKKVKNLVPHIARDVRKMHDAGIIHNDLHAGNILVEDINSEEPQLYYIDLNRARIKGELDDKERIKDLARLKFTNEEQRIFMKEYAPNNYNEFLDEMKEQRRRRVKFMEFKNKLKSFFRS